MTPSLTTIDLLALLAAVPAAALGGSAFLKGVLGIAAWLRLPKLLVATTLAAFATSSPEMAVSSLAALSGEPEIGLGDALGSNIVNVGLILGLTLQFGSLAANPSELRRDFAVALFVPVLTMVLALDGTLSRADGVLLLSLFALWLTVVLNQAIAHRRKAVTNSDEAVYRLRSWLYLIAGLFALILAGRLFIFGASGIASAMKVHPYLIGVTVVAIGTSLPELVTVFLSRMRGHDDVGLGTLLGSNLFNGFAIVGLSATIHPVRTPPGEVVTALAFGVLTVLLMTPFRGTLTRQRGLALMGAYAAFLFVTVVEPR